MTLNIIQIVGQTENQSKRERYPMFLTEALPLFLLKHGSMHHMIECFHMKWTSLGTIFFKKIIKHKKDLTRLDQSAVFSILWKSVQNLPNSMVFFAALRANIAFTKVLSFKNPCDYYCFTTGSFSFGPKMLS